MRKLEMVKKLAQEGKIQKALDKLSEVTLNTDKIELVDVFMKRYNTGEEIYQQAVINGTELHDDSVDCNDDGTYYEYCDKDGLIMVVDVTTESIIEAVQELESILKIA